MRNKVKRVIILIMCAVLFIQGCGSVKEEKRPTFEYYFDMDYWNIMPLEKSYYPTQEDLEADIVETVSEIEELLGVQAWWMNAAPNAETIGFDVDIRKSGTSFAYKMPKTDSSRVEVQLILNLGSGVDGAIAHELTHIMIDSDFAFSLSLEEGLCNYVQSQVGAYPDMVEYGWDIEEFIKRYLEYGIHVSGFSSEEVQEIVDTIGVSGSGYPYGNTSDRAALWYIYSQSFVSYLIRVYGVEKVVDLVRNGIDENSYEEYLGISFSTVKSEWLAYLEALEPVMTEQEMADAMMSICVK